MLAPLVFDPLYKTDLRSFGFDKPFALDRGELVLQKLRETWPDLTVHKPVPIEDADILTVHTARYLESCHRSLLTSNSNQVARSRRFNWR